MKRNKVLLNTWSWSAKKYKRNKMLHKKMLGQLVTNNSVAQSLT